jgi:hypothetical protein
VHWTGLRPAAQFACLGHCFLLTASAQKLTGYTQPLNLHVSATRLTATT